MPKGKSLDVEGEYADQRLDVILPSIWPEFSRNQWQQLIAKRAAKVNGQIASPSNRLKVGDRVTYLGLDTEDSAVDIGGNNRVKLPIIYQDDDVIVIDKPAGLSVHEGDTASSEPTVASLLAADIEQDGTKRAGIVHRLDKDTSGVMIVARRKKAVEFLQQQFMSRQVDKRYIALVWGHPRRERARIELPIGRHHSQPTKMSITPEGKPAITEYEVTKHYDNCTLLSIRLLTGRMHQIRVHLSYLGHPVVGDAVYGKKPKPPGLNRQFLHAAKLSLVLPSGKAKTFSAVLPAELADFLGGLSK